MGHWGTRTLQGLLHQAELLATTLPDLVFTTGDAHTAPPCSGSSALFASSTATINRYAMLCDRLATAPTDAAAFDTAADALAAILDHAAAGRGVVTAPFAPPLPASTRTLPWQTSTPSPITS